MFFFFQLENGTWIEDEDQTLKIKANFVISAFGSTLSDSDGKRVKTSHFDYKLYASSMFQLQNNVQLHIIK